MKLQPLNQKDYDLIRIASKIIEARYEDGRHTMRAAVLCDGDAINVGVNIYSLSVNNNSCIEVGIMVAFLHAHYMFVGSVGESIRSQANGSRASGYYSSEIRKSHVLMSPSGMVEIPRL